MTGKQRIFWVDRELTFLAIIMVKAGLKSTSTQAQLMHGLQHAQMALPADRQRSRLYPSDPLPPDFIEIMERVEEVLELLPTAPALNTLGPAPLARSSKAASTSKLKALDAKVDARFDQLKAMMESLMRGQLTTS